MLDVTPVHTKAGLLDGLRPEVNTIVTSSNSKSGTIRKFDMTISKTNCSIMTHTIQDGPRY